MKILYVVHQYFPDCFSGTEQYCLATTREARRRGVDCGVLSLVPDGSRDRPPLRVVDEPYDGTPVLRLRHWAGLLPNDVLRDYRNPLVAAAFRDVLREVRPTVVHFFHLRNLGADLIRVAREEGARTVVHLMDFWYLCIRFTLLRSDGSLCDGPPEGGLGCVRCHAPELDGIFDDAAFAPTVRDLAQAAGVAGLAARRSERFAALVQRHGALLERLVEADAIVAPSRFLAEVFARNGLPRERIEVVPYGIESGLVQRSDVPRPRDPIRIAFAGVLSPWKSPHVAVDALRKTRSDRVRLTVHGRLEESMFAEYIADLRRRAGEDPRIVFAGAFDRARVSAVMAETDLLIVPSTWYENTPFVMLEAFAAGLPVAASDLGGMAELIRPGVNGFVFPAGDSDALAALIESLAREPERLAALRPAAPPSIADDFDRFTALYAG